MVAFFGIFRLASDEPLSTQVGHRLAPFAISGADVQRRSPPMASRPCRPFIRWFLLLQSAVRGRGFKWLGWVNSKNSVQTERQLRCGKRRHFS